MRTQGKVEIRYIAPLAETPRIYSIKEDEVICTTLESGECKGNALDAEHITALWNASEGMSTERAVKYLELGEKAEEVIRLLMLYCDNLAEVVDVKHSINGSYNYAKDLLSQMEEIE